MNIQVVTSPFVNVFVTSNLSEFSAEKRFDKSITIGDLKGRLELITGASSGSMTIQVFNKENGYVCNLVDDSKPLGLYDVEENYRIHVTDSQKKVGEFDDLSKVEKFDLTDEEYSKKSDSVRSYLKRNQLGKYNEEEQKRMQEEKEEEAKAQQEKANTMKIGDRCEAKTATSGTQRGTIRFIGETQFKSGLWVGVEYDLPVGKNNGSVDGVEYFSCSNKYGAFVRPLAVQTGDFPEINDDLDEM